MLLLKLISLLNHLKSKVSHFMLNIQILQFKKLTLLIILPLIGMVYQIKLTAYFSLIMLMFPFQIIRAITVSISF